MFHPRKSPARVSVDVALSVLAAKTRALGSEEVMVTSAAGRVAAGDVRAAASVPHFDRAAMDGYALTGEATSGATPDAPIELSVIGDARPGRPFGGRVTRSAAVQITTGAPVPEGADAVLMTEVAAESVRDGQRFVLVSASVAAGKHISKEGEDVAAGSVIVSRGRRLRPQDAGLVASVGVPRIAVIRRPTVQILITGNELLRPGSVPEGARIIDSNSVVLCALAKRDGACEVTTVYVEDTRAAVREAIASCRDDVLLISGGSSVGPEDHAPLALAEVGEVAVHGVAMRPGGPAGFGFLEGGRLAFLLPGNPVSCLCAYEFFAGPTIRALGGLPRAWPHRRLTCEVAEAMLSKLGRTDYMRVRVEGDRVFPIMTSGASILSSTTRADGAAVLGDEIERREVGERVEVLLYD